ncbi:MAG: hypothetical protein JXQ30_04540 [Spirochaetes bacterium]|nr:hypothetical protein [Spirochaetota bacterium]
MRRKVFVSALSLTALISIGILLMSCSAGAIRELIEEAVGFFDANIKPGTPVPLAPGDGDDLYTGAVSRDVTFTWEKSNNAINYEIQVSTSDAFSSTVYSEPATTLTMSSTSLVTGVSSASSYYWRVRAQGASTLYSNWSAVRRVNINYSDTAVSPPELIAPGMGDELLPGAVTFSWKGVEGAVAYHVQLSASSTFASFLEDEVLPYDETTYESSSLSDGKYYWRVAASDGLNWSDWSTTYTFAVATQIGVPRLYSPKYGETLTTNKPSFTWSKVTGAEAYEIWVASDEKFQNLIIKDRTKDTTYESEVTFPNGKYLWMVRAQAFNGEWGEWSKYYVFAVEYTAGSLDPPKPIAPEYGQKFVPGEIEFLWSEVTGATGYAIVIAADPLFLRVIEETKTKSPAFAMKFEKYAEYFWKVFAFNDTLKSPWSKVFTFSVGYIGSPTLYAPVGEVVTTKTPKFSWSSVGGAAGYLIQVAGDESFASPVIKAEVGTNAYTPPEVPGLSNGTYYWRVMAKDGAGTWGKWSEIAKFKIDATQPVPKPPTLISPSGGAILGSLTVNFDWSDSIDPDATSYTLQASRYSTFSVILLAKTVATSYLNEVLFKEEGTYYWRVCANNAGGSSSYSTSKFSIKTVTYPDPPKLMSPINGAVAGNPVSFVWDDMGMESYAVEVAVDKYFEKLVAKGEITSVSTCTEEQLERETIPLKDGVYWWRVYSYNGTYYSKPSEPSYFTKDSSTLDDNLLMNGGFEKEESFAEKHIIYNPKLIETNFPQNGDRPIKPVTILEKDYALDTYWYRYLHEEKYAACKSITYTDAVHGDDYGLLVAVTASGSEIPFGGYYEQVVKVADQVSIDGYFKEISRDGYGATGIQFEWLEGGVTRLVYRVFVDYTEGSPMEAFGWGEGWLYNKQTDIWYYNERNNAKDGDVWHSPAQHTLNNLITNTSPDAGAQELMEAILEGKVVVDSIRVRLLVAPIGTSTLVGGFDDIWVEYE